MAVWTCGKCGHDNSVGSSVCSTCGTRRGQSNTLGYVVVGVLASVGLLIAAASCSPSERRQEADASSTPPASAATAMEPAAEATPPPEPEPVIGAQWSYSANQDPMTGKTTYSAMVTSSNELNFESPYDGPQSGFLVVRTHPSHGRDIIVAIEKGQILCRSYEDCTIRVRFDDEDPVSWAAVGPADNSSESVFLRNYDRFLAKLKKAERVRIALPVYRNGEPMLEFDVSGFDPNKYKPK